MSPRRGVEGKTAFLGKVMNELILTVIRVLLLTLILLILWHQGRKRPHLRYEGWFLILGGLGLILFGSLSATARILTGAEGGDNVIALTENLVGFGGGGLMALVGLFRWSPRSAPLDEVEAFSKQLTDAYARVEVHNQDLRESERWTRRVSQSASDAIISIDATGAVNFWNQGATTIFGYREEEILGQPVEILMPGEEKGAFRDALKAHEPGALGHPGRVVEKRGVKKGGEIFPIELSVTSWTMKGAANHTAVIRDISARKATEEGALRVQQSRVAISALLQIALEPTSLEEQLEKALEVVLSAPWLTIESKGSIFLTDPNGEGLVMAAEKGLAVPLLEKCARIPMGYCLCGRAAERGEMLFSDCIDHQHDVTFDGIKPHGHYCVPIKSQDRLLGVVNTYIPHKHKKNDEDVAFLQAVANTLAGVIERKKVEEKLKRMALFDALTGLPNRKNFLDRLAQDIARAAREKTELAVMFMDLDKFKQVNDTLGHDIGDLLLKEASARIRGALREGDTVARMGGDEFTLALHLLSNPADAGRVAEKIITRLGEPFELEGHTCHIGASIGISFYPKDGMEAEILLKQADDAMYAVKKKGRNNFLFFDKGMAKKESGKKKK